MNVRILTLAQMAMVARYFVGPARPVLAALPGGENLIAAFERFLAAISTPDTAVAQQIVALDALLLVLDALHDRLLRGLFLLLESLAELTDDAALAAGYRALQKRLFPGGLAMVNRTWLEEAEAATTVLSRLEPGDDALMAAFRLADGTSFVDLVTRYSDIGRTLGEKDIERAELRAQDKRLSVAQIGEARRLFGNTIGYLESTLTFHGIAPEVREKLFSKLEEAIKAGEARARRRAAGEQVVEDADTLPITDGGDATG
jgi:hypothetical protein